MKIPNNKGMDFPVYTNPNKDQAKTVADKSPYGVFRTIKDDKNLYFWDSHQNIHKHVAYHLGIEYNKQNCGYFTDKHLRDNNYDVAKTHSEHIDQTSDIE